MSQGERDNRQLLKQALLELEAMQADLEQLQNAKTEPIAVIGLGCRFPGGANSPEEFWRLLHDGVDAVAEIPKHRWDLDQYYDADPEAPGKVYARHAALLAQAEIEQFD